MSIASMSDASFARQRGGIKLGRGKRKQPRTAHPAHGAAADAHAPAPITPLPAANDVARWIPTEAIAIYLAFYAGIWGTSTNSDYTSRWEFFLIGGLGGTTVLVFLIFTAKWQHAQNVRYQPPIFEILIADLAFSAWALALPGSPATGLSFHGDWFP